MHHLGLFLLGVTAAALVAGNTCAAETVTSEVPAADLKELNDPTILAPRVWNETEWNSFENGTDVVENTFGGFWAWRISENQDWGVRLKLPWKFRVGGDMPDIGGLGDVKIATGTAIRLSKTFRIGAGLDVEMPTGRSELSDNFWRAQPFAAMGWDITSWLTFAPSWEYNQSFSEESSAAKANFLESFFPFIFILPNKWAVTLGYENKIDFENDDYVTHRAKIQVAKELETVPLSFALSAKRDFDSGEKEFQVNFVVSYFFRSKPAPKPSAPYAK